MDKRKIKLSNIIHCLSFITGAILCYVTCNLSASSCCKYIVKFQNEIRPNFTQTEINSTFNIIYTITPRTLILTFDGPRQHSRGYLKTIWEETFFNKVVALEPVRIYKDDLRPEETESTDLLPDGQGYTDDFLNKLFNPANEVYNNDLQPPNAPNLVCSNYYGMGVEGAWAAGFTGEGVVVGVTDVGVNMDFRDLSDNIEKFRSYNFISNNMDPTPEYLHNIQEKAKYFTDHGNRVASIIAAVKGNNLCSAGIAFNATLAALKIFEVKESNHVPALHPGHWTRSDITARALRHGPDEIDILANAWAPVQPFDSLDQATRDAVEYGATRDRKGLGKIYIVPSGPPGNGLANNIHTITVNAIGMHGTIPDDVFVDASVITSGLAFGNNITSTSAVTTSFKDKCISSFRGVSLATAQISGITALALQASKNLTLRDLQHLLVRSSEYKGLRERVAFKRNAANRRFHGVFGYGLLNATTLVALAKAWKPVSKLLNVTLQAIPGPRGLKFTFCYDCKDGDDSCLTTIEHAVVSVKLQSSSDLVRIALRSPKGTTSVIMDYRTEGPFQFSTTDFVSTHFWDEEALGSWILIIKQKPGNGYISIENVALTLYGTQDDYVRSLEDTLPGNCGSKLTASDTNLKEKNTDILSMNTPIKIDVETIEHDTKSKESSSNKKEIVASEAKGSEITPLYALLVLAIIVLFVIIFEKRYGLGSIIQYCPEMNKLCPKANRGNTTDQRPLI